MDHRHSSARVLYHLYAAPMGPDVFPLIWLPHLHHRCTRLTKRSFYHHPPRRSSARGTCLRLSWLWHVSVAARVASRPVARAVCPHVLRGVPRYRVTEIFYRRSAKSTESVVLYLPDTGALLPSRVDWEKLQATYRQALQAKLNPAAAAAQDEKARETADGAAGAAPGYRGRWWRPGGILWWWWCAVCCPVLQEKRTTRRRRRPQRKRRSSGC